MKNYRYALSLHQMSEAVKYYLDGKSIRQVAKAFQTTPKTIAKVLKREGVAIRQERPRLYRLDKHYFDVIDSDNKAYILGLIFADGSLAAKKKTFSISLVESDKDLLKAVSNAIGYSGPLMYIPAKTFSYRGKTYNGKAQNRLVVNCIEMYESLTRLGLMPNKSDKIRMPFPFVPSHLLRHFIRGFFDGDGGIKRHLRKARKTVSYQAHICSNAAFCTQLKDYIESILGFHCSVSHTKGKAAYFVCGGNRQVEQFLDYLYFDAELFLIRKWMIYQEVKNRFCLQ